MSGFEIAGIVLGAIPLFIGAAENYRKGLSTVGKFLKKEQVLQVYVQELETHQTLLRLQLQRIISGTDLSAKIQADLIDNSIGNEWQREDVQNQLRRSLGDDASGVLQRTMQRMIDTFLQQIETDDALPGHEQYKLQKGSSLRHIVATSKKQDSIWTAAFFQRVKFTWRSPKRNETLLELKSCNDNLFKLINAVQEARPYQMKQQVRKVHAAWQSRVEAQRLHDVLTNMCTCSCDPPHHSKLRIKPCTDDDDECSDYLCVTFDITFEHSLQNAHAMTVQMYRKVVQVSRHSGVTIAIPSGSSTLDKTKWKNISDFCSRIQATTNTDKHLVLAIDEAKALWEAGQRSTVRSGSTSGAESSLESLFPLLVKFAGKKWLIREKLILAVISAYSTLQLCESPWLQSGFSSDQIFFTLSKSQVDAAIGSTAGNALGQPYLSSDVRSSGHTLPMASYAHRNVHLLSLGTMLLELHLNKPISRSGLTLAELKIQAMDLLEQHYDDCSMSPCYYEAVRFCLFPKPDPSSRLMEFSDHGFRELYYRSVILPLEEELYENFEIGRKFWDDL